MRADHRLTSLIIVRDTLASHRKKSWHPLLITNQERVWKVEKVKVRTPTDGACARMLSRPKLTPFSLLIPTDDARVSRLRRPRRRSS